MPKKLLAVALDSADLDLIKRWSSEGLLPNFKKVLRRGTAISLGNYPVYRNENPWVSLHTGCFPDVTGYWTPIKYSGSSYHLTPGEHYNFEKYPPFYKYLDGRSATIFDLPHCGKLFPSIHGIQVLGWGAHSSMCDLMSHPAGIAEKLKKRFGTHPAMKIQNKGTLWQTDQLIKLREALVIGLKKRGSIIRTLLTEYPSDLNIITFGEIHIATHHFWHLSDTGHPAFGLNPPPLNNLLLDIYIETDRQLGKVLDLIPASTDLVLFSPEGGAPNWCDLNSTVFLPELLFRWNFPGRSLIKPEYHASLPPPVVPEYKDWARSVWKQTYSNLPPSWVMNLIQNPFRKIASIKGLNFPFYVLRRFGKLQWQPATWYKPWWPRMKAFALPSYGDGYIRFNVKGRDRNGVVEKNDIDNLARTLKNKLFKLSDPKTGERLVRDIIRPENDLKGIGPGNRPDADMIVLWAKRSFDMVEDNESGIIGPVPFGKSGSHRPAGFIIGDRLASAKSDPSASSTVIDIAPTILGLLNISQPPHMKGEKLLKQLKDKT